MVKLRLLLRKYQRWSDDKVLVPIDEMQTVDININNEKLEELLDGEFFIDKVWANTDLRCGFAVINRKE